MPRYIVVKSPMCYAWHVMDINNGSYTHFNFLSPHVAKAYASRYNWENENATKLHG